MHPIDFNSPDGVYVLRNNFIEACVHFRTSSHLMDYDIEYFIELTVNKVVHKIEGEITRKEYTEWLNLMLKTRPKQVKPVLYYFTEEVFVPVVSRKLAEILLREAITADLYENFSQIATKVTTTGLTPASAPISYNEYLDAYEKTALLPITRTTIHKDK